MCKVSFLIKVRVKNVINSGLGIKPLQYKITVSVLIYLLFYVSIFFELL